MCPEGKILSAYLDGEIEAPWNGKIKEHVENCTKCKNILNDLKALRNSLLADKEPECSWAMKRLKNELELNPPLPVRFWNRRVNLPLPVAAAAAILVILMSTSIFFLSSRSNIRQMSIRREPSGATEIQVAVSIEELEHLLKSLDNPAFRQEVIIELPKETHFIMFSEPQILREADFSGSKKW